MRYLVLSDIHANLEALDACLTHASARAYEQTVVLGDLVGYGADPNAVIERVQALAPAIVIRGNHDKIAIDLSEADDFNPMARNAARWTHEALTSAHREWLAALPQGPRVVDDILQICHGSPFDEDAYIFDELDAHRALASASRPLCMFGHTHVPAVFHLTSAELGADQPPPTDVETFIVLEDHVKYLLNPGAVGQPRDGNPLAAYAVADTTAKRVELFRVPYPIEKAQQKILAAGLPDVLAKRLASGR